MPRLTRVDAAKGGTDVKPSCLVAFTEERGDRPDDGFSLFLVQAPRPESVQPANRLAAAAPKNTMPESAVIQKLVGQSV